MQVSEIFYVLIEIVSTFNHNPIYKRKIFIELELRNRSKYISAKIQFFISIFTTSKMKRAKRQMDRHN